VIPADLGGGVVPRVLAPIAEEARMRPKDVRGGELDEAFRSLSPWLERRLALRGVRGAEADDIVQESFLRLGRYLGSTAIRSPRALLLRIAANLATDAARRHSTREGAGRVGPEALEGAAADEVDPGFLLELKRTVMGLPPGLRDAFLLARFTPMTNAEIARHLGISTKTVEWRISRAVSICLARLGD